MLSAFSLLAKFKGLRGTAFDIFGYSAERRQERELISRYRETIEELLNSLTPQNLALAVEIASVPEMIRGYGHVKSRHLLEAQAHETDLISAYRAGKSAAPDRIAAE